MEQENRPSEEALMAREEKCRKSIRAVGKAVFMRLFVTAILIWAAFQTNGEIWVLGLMVFVMIINASGLVPLLTELKSRRRELKEIMAQYE